MVSSNLFVKGLPSDIVESSLKALFGQYGTVTKVKILPQTEGMPNVAGFVNMATTEEAQWIIDNVNGNIPQGLKTPVEVSIAIDKSAKGKGKGTWGGGASGAGKVEGPSLNLWVGNLPTTVDSNALKELFSQYGPVKSCKVLGPDPKKAEVAAGMVEYEDLENSKWVKENVDGNIPQGLEQPVTINYAPGPQAKGGGKGAYGTVPPGNQMMNQMMQMWNAMKGSKGGWEKKSGMPGIPCGNPQCEYLAHTDPATCVGFCCLKCEGIFNGEEWAIGGKSHYKHCEKRMNPFPGGGGGMLGAAEQMMQGTKRTFDEMEGMQGPGGLGQGVETRAQQPCANPGCEYLVHSDPSECENYCCLKCEGRHQGADWAMGGLKKHYAQCEKRSLGDPVGFSSTQMMNQAFNAMPWGSRGGKR